MSGRKVKPGSQIVSFFDSVYHCPLGFSAPECAFCETTMPDIRLPDGSVRSYDAALSGAEVAADIGKGLARDALAVRIDGELQDLGTLIENDAEVAIVTGDQPDGL